MDSNGIRRTQVWWLGRNRTTDTRAFKPFRLLGGHGNCDELEFESQTYPREDLASYFLDIVCLRL